MATMNVVILPVDAFLARVAFAFAFGRLTDVFLWTPFNSHAMTSAASNLDASASARSAGDTFSHLPNAIHWAYARDSWIAASWSPILTVEAEAEFCWGMRRGVPLTEEKMAELQRKKRKEQELKKLGKPIGEEAKLTELEKQALLVHDLKAKKAEGKMLGAEETVMLEWQEQVDAEYAENKRIHSVTTVRYVDDVRSEWSGLEQGWGDVVKIRDRAQDYFKVYLTERQARVIRDWDAQAVIKYQTVAKEPLKLEALKRAWKLAVSVETEALSHWKTLYMPYIVLKVKDLNGVTVNGRVLSGRSLSEHLDSCPGVPNRLRFRVAPKGIFMNDTTSFAKLCMTYTCVCITDFAVPNYDGEPGDCPYCAKGVGEPKDCICGEDET